MPDGDFTLFKVLTKKPFSIKLLEKTQATWVWKGSHLKGAHSEVWFRNCKERFQWIPDQKAGAGNGKMSWHRGVMLKRLPFV